MSWSASIVSALAVALTIAGCQKKEPFDMAAVSSNLEVFSMDSAAMKANYLVEVPIGELELPDGRLVAMDPLVMPEMDPFERKVPEGVYPVTFIRGDEEYARPALLVIRFSDEPVERFELATRPEQNVEDLEEGYFYGIPVDTGLAAFANSGFAAAEEKRDAEERERRGDDYISYYDDVLAEALPGDSNDEHVLHHPLEGDFGAAAIGQSGWGDGFYPVIWGFAADDSPVLAFIDFYVIENGEGLEPGELASRRALDAMTEQQKADNVAAYDAMKMGDMNGFAAYVDDKRIKPEDPVIPTGGSFMAEAIRLNNAEALKIMMDAGARAKPGAVDSEWIESYYGYAEDLNEGARKTGKIPPRSEELMALLRQLESENAAQ